VHATKGDDMTRPTYVDKVQIVATLRSRGLQGPAQAAEHADYARADWVDRELPELVDTYRNAALFQILDIDPVVMAPSDPAPQGR